MRLALSGCCQDCICGLVPSSMHVETVQHGFQELPLKLETVTANANLTCWWRFLDGDELAKLQEALKIHSASDMGVDENRGPPI